MLTRQDVGRWIQTTKTANVKDWATNSEAKDYGVSQTVSPVASVLVSDHSIVLWMASFNSSETELSNDAI